MKQLIASFIFLTVYLSAFSQTAENMIIITTDGFRWQEVFGGMDSAIANNNKYNQDDSAAIFKKYWADNPSERRKKIMPFLWSIIERNGQIYGNRNLGNKINNANPYWFSYPGYNEIFTGYPDTLVNSNSYPPNPNTNLLEFLNKNPKYKNKVAAFGAWEAFDRILNEGRSKIPVYSAFDPFGKITIDTGKNFSVNNPLLNEKVKNKPIYSGINPFKKTYPMPLKEFSMN